MNRQSEQSVSLSVSDAGIVSKRLYTASRKDWQYFGKDFNIYGGIFIIIGKDQFNPPNNFKNGNILSILFSTLILVIYLSRDLTDFESIDILDMIARRNLPGPKI